MVDLVTGIVSFIDIVWTLLSFIITDIGLIISIIFNPFLFLMIVLTLANIYTVIKSKTRREIIVNYGKFFSMTANAIFNTISAAIPVIMSLIQSVTGLIQGGMTSWGTGTLITAAIIIILLAYSIVTY